MDERRDLISCFRRALALDRLLLYLTALGVFLLYGCAPPMTSEELEARYGRQTPTILKYGAVDRLKSGQTWRVFMAAEDMDGDMDTVVFEMHQPGLGWYPAHWKRLGVESARSFSGYFFLNTPAFRTQGLWGLQLTLTCKVRDKAGHSSELIRLPLKFVGKKVPQPAPEGFTQQDVRSLGPIMIDLRADDDQSFFINRIH